MVIQGKALLDSPRKYNKPKRNIHQDSEPQKKIPLIKYEVPKKEKETFKFKGMHWRTINVLDPTKKLASSLKEVNNEELNLIDNNENNIEGNIEENKEEYINEIKDNVTEKQIEDSIKNETSQNQYFSETATELNKLTSQFCIEISEPVQSIRPNTSVVTKKSAQSKSAVSKSELIKPEVIKSEAKEEAQPKTDYRRKNKRVLFTELLKGVDEGTKADIKEKVNNEIEVWNNKAKEKREQIITKLGSNKKHKGNELNNEDPNLGKTMVITNAVKKYGSRFSQRKNILHDLIYC